MTIGNTSTFASTFPHTPKYTGFYIINHEYIQYSYIYSRMLKCLIIRNDLKVIAEVRGRMSSQVGDCAFYSVAYHDPLLPLRSSALQHYHHDVLCTYHCTSHTVDCTDALMETDRSVVTCRSVAYQQRERNRDRRRCRRRSSWQWNVAMDVATTVRRWWR